jgi:hypothetical protein
VSACTDSLNILITRTTKQFKLLSLIGWWEVGGGRFGGSGAEIMSLIS